MPQTRWSAAQQSRKTRWVPLRGEVSGVWQPANTSKTFQLVKAELRQHHWNLSATLVGLKLALAAKDSSEEGVWRWKEHDKHNQCWPKTFYLSDIANMTSAKCWFITCLGDSFPSWVKDSIGAEISSWLVEFTSPFALELNQTSLCH